MFSLLTIASQIALALLLDKIFGELSRYHPLVGFGRLATGLENTFNQNQHKVVSRITGACCWLLLVAPLPILLFMLQQPHFAYYLLEVFVLYLAVAQKSLAKHAMQIYQPLQTGDLEQARHYTSYMVSRDTQQLTEADMSRATVESVLENGHDAIIASLFYFLLGGAPLVLLHRLINTLDAMWGYKTSRFLHFGWAAAKCDDVLGFLSACVSSVLYTVTKGKRSQWRAVLCLAWQQSTQYKSKNGGLCMSAGAQVLGLQLGGNASYHGESIAGVILGHGKQVTTQDIPASIDLVNQSANLFVVLTFILGAALWIIT